MITDEQIKRALDIASKAEHKVVSLNPLFKWTKGLAKSYEIDKQYRCRHCGLKIIERYKTLIYRHEKECKETPYVCRYCGGYCKSKAGLTLHEKNCE
ncbi:MAG TPA: hypothetical protein VFM18_11795 [Methanosarcina sp.]|nr:hypothetical protein [Methanosarcina sp.]